jgi:hypothetical protein
MDQEEGAHQVLSLDFPRLQNCDKLISVIYKPLGLWYFVTIAHYPKMSAEGGSQEDATSEGDMVKVK